MTPEQAAKRLGVSRKLVYRLCQSGLTHYRLGGRIRIDEADLNDFLAAKKQGGEKRDAPLPVTRRKLDLKILKLN